MGTRSTSFFASAKKMRLFASGQKVRSVDGKRQRKTKGKMSRKRVVARPYGFKPHKGNISISEIPLKGFNPSSHPKIWLQPVGENPIPGVPITFKKITVI